MATTRFMDLHQAKTSHSLFSSNGLYFFSVKREGMLSASRPSPNIVYNGNFLHWVRPSCVYNCSRARVCKRCITKGGIAGVNRVGAGEEEMKHVVVPKAALASANVSTAETKTDTLVDVLWLFGNISHVMSQSLKAFIKQWPWKLFHAQVLVERAILNCRFLTLFAVAGSLFSSLLCYVEGCFIILESYFQYFQAISQGSEQGHILQLLIEAIDMFLIGNAMLIFGMGLYVMFIGSKHPQGRTSKSHESNFLGSFYSETLPSWAGMQSVMQAKSNLGQAAIMILQVGVIEKFKSIPLVTGMDLACFAAAVFVSSSSIFLLSRLAVDTSTDQMHHT